MRAYSALRLCQTVGIFSPSIWKMLTTALKAQIKETNIEMLY